MNLAELADLVRAEGGVPGEVRLLNNIDTDYSDIFVIGEAPGSTEEKQGRPFVGKAGKVLDEMMLEANIPAFYITNVCLIPTTPVLTSSLVWKQIKDVGVGEELVGFQEASQRGRGKRRALKRTKVLAKSAKRKECIRFTLSNGDVLTCTLGHRWLARRGHAALKWCYASDLTWGDRLPKFFDVWEQDGTWEAGWLAGAVDADGTLHTKDYPQLRFGQNEGDTLDLFTRGLASREFKYTKSASSHARPNFRNVYVKGGLAEVVRFLGTTQPPRLLSRFDIAAWKLNPSDYPEIIRIEHLPEMNVIDIETDTATFIANGYGSHNCKHFPGYTKLKKIAKPSKVEKERWWPILEEEIKLVKPTQILLMGAHAAQPYFFPGNWKMRDMVGVKEERNGVTYRVLYHPASFLYNQGTAANTRHMNKQRRILRDVLGEETVEYDYEVLSPNTYGGTLVIDIETKGGTDPRTATITEWSALRYGDE